MLCARVLKKLLKGNCIFLGNSNPFWPGDNWSFIDLYWYIVRRGQCSKVCYAGIFDYLTLLSRRFYFWKTFSAISCPSIGLIWRCSPETFRSVPFTDTCVHSQKILCFVWQLKTHYAVWSEKKNFPYLLKHFQIMDCKGKYCNYEDDGGNTESCQKCTDVEKCYKIPVR